VKRVSVVIPAYNEAETIGTVIEKAMKYADEIIVVDDGSTDKTGEIAAKKGAKVIRHKENRGYIEALRTGFEEATGDIIVTLDADGQHPPDEIPKLVEPILENKADLVLGAREELSLSEKIITLLTNLKVKASDASTGYRAIKKEIAKSMKIKGKCTCGTFVLEAAKLGARITEIKIKTKPRETGKSRINKKHFIQTLIVLKELLRTRP